MKNMKLFAFSIAALGLLTTSCSSDDATGDSVLEVNNGVTGTIAAVTPSLVFGSTINVNEADQDEFTFSVTLSKAQPVDIHLKVKQVGGTASAADFSTEEVVIPAYALSATGTIAILNDCEVEGNETLVIQIGDQTTANASIPTKTVTFNITNYLANGLDLTLNYNKAFSISGTSYTLNQIGYDIDFYLLDSSMNDTGIYDAASTGTSPESITIPNDGTLVDGEYYIFYDIYDDGGISGVYHDPFDIPVTVDYERCGGIAPNVFTQEAAFVANSTDGSGSGYVMTVELSAGVFTIKDSADTTIASGKSSNKSKVEAAIKAAREKRH